MNKEEIGTNAGMVWQALYANGAMSFDDLIETTGLNTESAYSALGWLAREDKLDFPWCHCMYIRKSTIDAV